MRKEGETTEQVFLSVSAFLYSEVILQTLTEQDKVTQCRLEPLGLSGMRKDLCNLLHPAHTCFLEVNQGQSLNKLLLTSFALRENT